MSNTTEQLTENGSGDAPKSDAYTPSYTLWTVAYFLLVWLRRDIDRIFNLYIVLVPLIVLPALSWSGEAPIAILLRNTALKAAGAINPMIGSRSLTRQP
jgi:hypothetical protein